MKRPLQRYKVTWRFPIFNWFPIGEWEYRFCPIYFVYDSWNGNPRSIDYRVSAYTPNRDIAYMDAYIKNTGDRNVTN